MASTQRNKDQQPSADTHLMGKSSGSNPPANSSNQDTHKHGRSFGYRYSTILAHYPVLVLFLILLVTVLCGVAAVHFYDLPDFSNPIKGFEARGTEISRRIFSHMNLNFPGQKRMSPMQRPDKVNLTYHARDGMKQPAMTDPFVNPADLVKVIYVNITSNGTTDGQPELVVINEYETVSEEADFCTIYPVASLARIVLVPRKTNTLFSAEAMRSMCSIENKFVRTHPSFDQACCQSPVHLRRDLRQQLDVATVEPELDVATVEPEQCVLSWSLGNVLAILNNKESCEDLQDSDVDNTKQILRECVDYYESGNLTETCSTGECEGVPEQCIGDGLVYKIFHYLTPISFVEEVKQDTFQLSSSMIFLPIEIWYFFDELWDIFADVFEGKVVGNKIAKVEALEFGIKYDLFAKYLRNDIKYLGLSAIIVVLIIIIYIRSPFLTIMTAVNMIMSLILAYSAYKLICQIPFFPFVNIAAAVLVIGIGADDTFVFVDIWNKAKRDITNGRRLTHEDRPAVVHETLKHASVTMFVTSFTTGSALYASAISSITAVKCFAIFAGTAIVANFVFTLTWLPVVVVINDMCGNVLSRITSKESDQSDTTKKGSCRTCCSNLGNLFTKVFTDYLQTVVFKLRIIWIILFLGLAVGGFFIVFVSPKLQLPSKSDFQVFRSSHICEKYTGIFNSKYSFSDDQVDLMPYSVVWGLHAEDNGNHWDPESTGHVVYDDQFNLSDPDSQEWLFNFCQSMRDQSFVSKTDQSYCFIEQLKIAMQSPCGVPGLSMPRPCCGRNDFPYPADDFNKCAAMFCANSNCLYEIGRFRFGPWFKNDTIVAFSVIATSTFKISMDYNLMDDFWNAANTWTEEQKQNAPAGMAGGWFISKTLMQLNFYDLQGSLATGAPAAMGISLGIAAAVLLLTTRNILISLYAMVSISGAVFVTIASLVLLGWELNIFESAILSLAVGLSVDFTIHYGVGYRLAPYNDQRGRTEFSIHTLAPAITVAALSTFAAGAMMMPATVLTYVQLGTFLMLVMTISWSYASFFFLALCRTIGPKGNIAQVPLPKCSKGKGQAKRPQEHVGNGHTVLDVDQDESSETEDSSEESQSSPAKSSPAKSEGSRMFKTTSI